LSVSKKAQLALKEPLAMSKRAIVIPVIVLGVAALLFLVISGRWTSWSGSRAEQETDDAYVQADITPLSTRISGIVRKMKVEDFDSVKAGQVLVEIDDDDYRSIVEEAKAALAASQAALEDNQAAKRVQEVKIQSAEAMVAEAQAAVSTAQAGIASTQPDVEQAAIERKRQDALLASKAATLQQREAAVAKAESYSGQLASRQADLTRAHAALASSRTQVEAEKQELAALDSRDATYKADIEEKRAAIIVAEVNLSYTRITAPADGKVGKRQVQEGQLVTPGMELVGLVRGDAWILANYLETQLTNIRKGDIVDIKIDAFPGVVLHGKVEEIAPASGSQSALLPPDNATGNFTKVVQRIPVKIALDPGHPLQGRLRPGLSTEVTIHTSGRSSDKNANAEGSQS
jgi:membrane fusion protein, multidrug efflux system